MRRWGIRFWGDCLFVRTPWFELWLADPEGAYDIIRHSRFSGVVIFWGWNPQPGCSPWKREKRLVYRELALYS